MDHTTAAEDAFDGEFRRLNVRFGHSLDLPAAAVATVLDHITAAHKARVAGEHRTALAALVEAHNAMNRYGDAPMAAVVTTTDVHCGDGATTTFTAGRAIIVHLYDEGAIGFDPEGYIVDLVAAQYEQLAV
ncbi:hypothetical protein AB0395_22095 [Streptosporangium sp. NPDC051023]|uniref:hypothetical protein n=1 Tax=Streptosporangium sp. NPDC051023 TaxID=3155410 RepID=UPI00344CC5D8